MNARLALLRHAEITLGEGETIGNARDVVVSEVDVRFTVRGEPFAVPVGAVEAIAGYERSAARHGVALGAVPGIVLLAVLGGDVLQSDGDSLDGIVYPALAVVGGLAVAVGVGVGSAAGRRTGAGERIQVYRAPVTQYLASPGVSYHRLD